jgi:hypothetical protein
LLQSYRSRTDLILLPRLRLVKRAAAPLRVLALQLSSKQ